MDAISESSIPIEAKSLFNYILEALQNSQRNEYQFLGNDEIALTIISLLKKQVDEMQRTLEKHDIKIEKLDGYENISHFVDEYIKHDLRDEKHE